MMSVARYLQSPLRDEIFLRADRSGMNFHGYRQKSLCDLGAELFANVTGEWDAAMCFGFL
jgi:hypothetical protein